MKNNSRKCADRTVRNSIIYPVLAGQKGTKDQII